MPASRRVVAIVQARLGSTRLRGKTLADIGGQTMLARTIGRLQRARTLDEIAVATSVEANDDAVAAETRALGVRCTRGSEADVLARYERAAAELEADVIVRATSDCPLIDPDVVDYVVESFFTPPEPDYCSNVLERTYPRGLDAEVIARAALDAAARDAVRAEEREHVTAYIYRHPELFRLRSVRGDQDMSHLRWTVDTAEDLKLIREIYRALGAAGDFGWRDVVGLHRIRPELTAWNSHVVQKPLS